MARGVGELGADGATVIRGARLAEALPGRAEAVDMGPAAVVLERDAGDGGVVDAGDVAIPPGKAVPAGDEAVGDASRVYRFTFCIQLGFHFILGNRR